MNASKKPPYTFQQKLAITEAFSVLKKQFPGLTERELIEGPMANRALGDLPAWSTLETHRLTNVMTSLRGAFVLCWFKDEENKVQVVMGARPTPDGGALYNASGGGFANLDFTPASTFTAASREGEQPAQNAARELREEICYENSHPVLDLDPARFVLISAGVDNRGLQKGGHPVDWCGFSVELTKAEADAIRGHCARLANDSWYLDACKKASGNETAFVKVMPLQDAAQIPPAQFAHPHESTVIAGLAARMAKKSPKPDNNAPKA